MIDALAEPVEGGNDSPLECSLLAASWKSVAAAELPRLRTEVAAAFPKTLSNGVLKQADEQNLPALIALKEALDAAHLHPSQCQDWGLVAVPRMLGRRRIADALTKFREQGAWSVSPHLTPNLSLHSASGLFSQALRLHGPNIGVGGMIGTESEGLWAAISLLVGEQLPGVWLILTGWDRESLENNGWQCQSAVLALRPGMGMPRIGCLSILPGRVAHSPSFSLELLGESIREKRMSRWSIGAGVCSVSFRSIAREMAA